MKYTKIVGIIISTIIIAFIFNCNNVNAKQQTVSGDDKLVFQNNDYGLCVVTVHKVLTQNYSVVDTNKRKYTYRSVYLTYKSAGAYSPTKASIGIVGYVNSSNKLVKSFTWKNMNTILPGQSVKIYAKENSTSVTYSVTNTNKFFASYQVYIKDTFIPTQSGSIELKLNNCL